MHARLVAIHVFPGLQIQIGIYMPYSDGYLWVSSSGQRIQNGVRTSEAHTLRKTHLHRNERLTVTAHEALEHMIFIANIRTFGS